MPSILDPSELLEATGYKVKAVNGASSPASTVKHDIDDLEVRPKARRYAYIPRPVLIFSSIRAIQPEV